MGTRKNRLSEAVLACTHDLCFVQKKKKIKYKKILHFFHLKKYHFYSREILQYIARTCLRNDCQFSMTFTIQIYPHGVHSMLTFIKASFETILDKKQLDLYLCL